MARSISPAGTFWLLVMPCERTTTVPAMEVIQNAVLDGPVGSTQFIDSIAQKIGCGTSQFVSGCGKQPHIVQAFRPGLRWEVIEPVYQRNASICLAENENFRRRHVSSIIVRLFANNVKLLLPSRHHPYFPRLRDRPDRQRIVTNLRLLLLVPLARPRRRTRTLRPPHVPH